MVRRTHRVRDVAEQAGVSEATVDRVLDGRPGVSARAVRAVEAAVLELERQQSQVRLSRRTLLVDVVLDAPGRFRDAVTAAVEDALPSARPATVRARFTTSEGASPEELAATVDGVGTAGRVSHGLVLKAPDHPAVAEAVRRSRQRGIPTVTLVTDVSGSGRLAYVGLDNAAAGATAAYLLTHLLRVPTGRCSPPSTTAASSVSRSGSPRSGSGSVSRSPAGRLSSSATCTARTGRPSAP